MIIDCHGHYTTAPKALDDYRARQTARLLEPGSPALPPDVRISDDEIRDSLERNQLRLQRERGIDMTILSPKASAMAHHVGNATTSLHWAQACNDLIHRVTLLYPAQFTGVCQLPQSPGHDLKASVAELERCVTGLGFVGCNVNPDPSDGHWSGPPLTDRYWYPLYEKMVELDVPAMIHVSCSCNPNFHHTGAHYLNADTAAFMQLLLSDVFVDFPTLRLVIPHGGGAVPYHWGRYRGLAQQMGRPPLDQLMRNVFFDTCVYHQPGIDLLLKVVSADNILFASEAFGAVKGIDPETGHAFDDTRRYIDAAQGLSADDRDKIYFRNACRVYPRLAAWADRHAALPHPTTP
ncbi:4-oxalmesaconate hydratase [Cupriavidus gilardii J11]|uniref:4-oxalmesaconate hydratase n=1 Tax=Cupriavidus gilardii J11 TaxID=936133 RepID=A0A562BSJ4_9BURK|nr:amidohydrolase family protein [Cupriavidus gilardii]TWG88275.1 4-oxalmesaconate hydratase [Cupriavidus gilardii J11]